MENTSQTSMAEPTASSPLESPDDEDVGTTGSFNMGKKIKRKRRKDKSDVLVDIMMRQLEVQEEQKEEKKKIHAEQQASLVRSEEREQKLVDIFEVLTKHFMEKWR